MFIKVMNAFREQLLLNEEDISIVKLQPDGDERAINFRANAMRPLRSVCAVRNRRRSLSRKLQLKLRLKKPRLKLLLS